MSRCGLACGNRNRSSRLQTRGDIHEAAIISVFGGSKIPRNQGNSYLHSLWIPPVLRPKFSLSILSAMIFPLGLFIMKREQKCLLERDHISYRRTDRFLSGQCIFFRRKVLTFSRNYTNYLMQSQTLTGYLPTRLSPS